MKRRWFCVGSLAVFVSVYLFGQANSKSHAESSTTHGYKAPESLRVAVVDVAYIFKNYKSFRTAMDKMKEQIDAAEEKLKAQQQAISELEEKEKLLADDSTEKAAVHSEHASQTNAFNASKELHGKAFMELEGKIYFKTSQIIDRTIARYCDKYGIHLVFKINGEPVDPKDHNDILRGINKPIPYVHPDLEITEEILASMNEEEVELLK